MKQKKFKHFRVTKYFYDLVHKQSQIENKSITDLILHSVENGYIVEFNLNEEDYKSTIGEMNQINKKIKVILKKLDYINNFFSEYDFTKEEAIDFLEQNFNENFLKNIEHISNQIFTIQDALCTNGELKRSVYKRKKTLMKDVLIKFEEKKTYGNTKKNTYNNFTNKWGYFK